MGGCDFCGKPFEGFPHKCKYCGETHCSDHILPESHECIGLAYRKQRNHEKWKETISDSLGSRYAPKTHSYDNQEIEEKEESHKPVKAKQPVKNSNKKLTTSEKLKHFGLEKYESFRYWLRKREHNRYDYEGRANYLITTILLFAASIVGLVVFYSNAAKINEIDLWIIKLAGVLLLASLFFTIKFGWRLGKELVNMFKRQRNWLRYLLIIIIAILIWQTYTHKDTVLNPVLENYHQTNFTRFAPLSFGNLSLDSTSSPSHSYSNPSNNKGGSGFSNFVNGIIDPKSQIDINELEQKVHELINDERTSHGLRPLQWDDKIALIAREHSQDMATNDFFSHDNLRGEDPTDRGNRHGYSCRKDYGSYYTYGLAENIALTPIYSDVVGCGSTTSLDSLAECIVDGWMDSPGHRENILTSTYTKAGVGIAYSINDEAYSTQDFC